MEVIYGLLPGMLLLGIIGVGLFFWAVRSGQYDDMEGSANRILMDDDPVNTPTDTEVEKTEQTSNEVEREQERKQK
ncbi:MAG: cbb3-type cytochrome oxidase assembly protein CcoS [Gammaproteobacteria bacterium]|nr:cbb3-type cytochrome oxidase assembly protein CcoS [Gammaproteobacteria bacterium]MDH5592536.1 cbb3-type cytochrome oxidase assembly protein CcoS [Gammaproteobacteria bacterium]